MMDPNTRFPCSKNLLCDEFTDDEHHQRISSDHEAPASCLFGNHETSTLPRTKPTNTGPKSRGPNSASGRTRAASR